MAKDIIGHESFSEVTGTKVSPIPSKPQSQTQITGFFAHGEIRSRSFQFLFRRMVIALIISVVQHWDDSRLVVPSNIMWLRQIVSSRRAARRGRKQIIEFWHDRLLLDDAYT